jgi:hypothetical protein
MTQAPHTTRTGFQSLDFPDILRNSYHSTKHFTLPLAVVFLFKTSPSHRQEILQQLEQHNAPSWPEDIPQRPLVAVPWYRTFTPNIHDVIHMDAGGPCIYISPELLEDTKCLVAHNQCHPAPSFLPKPREFAIVELREAYQLACASTTLESWFPSHLPSSCNFTPTASTAKSDAPETPLPFTELPVIVTVRLTSEQEKYLYALLSCEMAEPGPAFLHVPNPSPDTTTDIHHLMSYFQQTAWFPGDFVVVDAGTVSSLPTPLNLPVSAPQSVPNEAAAYPSFTLVTELLIWHATQDKWGRQHVGKDSVGYATGQRTMKDDEEYGDWCSGDSRGQGLGFYAWENYGGYKGEEVYFWGCWVDGEDRVDEEVRGGMVVKS